MKLQLLGLVAGVSLFCGAQRATYAAGIDIQIGGAPAPAPVVVEAPPTFVEEGTTVNGVVVAAPPGAVDYVNIDGGWYYWQPTLNVWVHANHPRDWHPAGGGHIFQHWSDHPMYKHGR